MIFFSLLLLCFFSHTPKNQKKKVEEVLQLLGLTNCADTVIGTPFLRGVSGGERRRASIGVELVTNPSK
jgi:ABC-type multidrug transport system ATPase subunit